MWNVDTKILCNKHLLGEHVEMHMFKGTIEKGISINGYIENGLVDLGNIKNRHDVIVIEMKNRNFNHNSDMEAFNEGNKIITIDQHKNLLELKNRCSNCKKRIGDNDEV